LQCLRDRLMRRLTWSEVRARKVRALRIFVSLTAILSGSYEIQFHGSLQALNKSVSTLDALYNAFGVLQVNIKAVGWIGLTVLFLYLWWRSPRIASIVDRLHDQFFASFNYDILQPIGPPLAFDPFIGSPGDQGVPALEWVEPTEGTPRKVAWDRLAAFLSDFTGDGTQSFFGLRACLKSFKRAPGDSA
jgi:hypothetical protein